MLSGGLRNPSFLQRETYSRDIGVEKPYETSCIMSESILGGPESEQRFSPLATAYPSGKNWLLVALRVLPRSPKVLEAFSE